MNFASNSINVWRRPARLPFQSCLLAASILGVLTSSTAAEPPVLRTRQKVFEIPFSIASPASPKNQPAEVQLMVSGDRGNSWQLYQRQSPSVEKFAFQAGPDGEFWFQVRTLGSRGELIGTPRKGPELIVIVDTDRPLLELESSVGPSGEVQAQWRIADANLDISTFTLEYRSDSSQQWQRVAVDYPQDGMARDTVDGQARWWPTANGGPLTVRGQVQDGAGNVTVVQRRVEYSPVARPQTPAQWLPPINTQPPNAPRANTPLANRQPAQPANAPPANAPNMAAAVPRGNRPAATPGVTVNSASSFTHQGLVANNPYFQTPTPVPPATAGPDAQTPPTDTPWIARRATQAPIPYHDHARSWQANDLNRPAGDNMTAGQPPEITALGTRDDHLTGQEMANAPAHSPGRMVTHGTQHPATTSRTPDSGAASADPNRIVDPNNLRVSKSRRFRLDYDVEAVGQAGVDRVELWTTRNQGQTWQHYGDDPDKMSPFMVTVDQDGVYGYRLVIQAKQGLAMRPPNTGDPADIWISVDATPPTARITSARYGSGTDAGRLLITWEAFDQNLEKGSITLSSSPHRDGPWTPIAEGIENTGSYPWQVDGNIPRLVYLRLQVRDQAGNMTEYRLEEPISSDGLAPRGRIRGVAPAQFLNTVRP